MRGRPTLFREDFLLEQSCDATLRSAYDQVIAIDGTRVQPDAVLTHQYFVVVRDRLYRMGRDSQSAEVVTQLLVPRSRREMVFQAAHYNPMAGHLGYDKTISRIPSHKRFGRRCAGGAPPVPIVSW